MGRMRTVSVLQEAPQSFYVKLVKQNKNLGLLVLSNMSAPLTADDADGNLVEIDLDTRLLNLSCRLRYVYFKVKFLTLFTASLKIKLNYSKRFRHLYVASLEKTTTMTLMTVGRDEDASAVVTPIATQQMTTTRKIKTKKTGKRKIQMRKIKPWKIKTLKMKAKTRQMMRTMK